MLPRDRQQWRLLRGERLIILAGTERMEWHQTHGNHVFDVFDTFPRAHPPQLRCYQPPLTDWIGLGKHYVNGVCNNIYKPATLNNWKIIHKYISL